MSDVLSLISRLKSSGSIKSQTLSESTFFNKKDVIQTDIPALNIALSGSVDGGLTPGLTFIAGPSRHFKSMFGLLMMKAYLDKYKESVALFVDSEFGITPQYMQTVGIDIDRVLHIPVEHVEQLKFDLVSRLDEIKRGDKVFILIDSIGNLASKKEVEDARDEKAVTDMTRAKSIKSLFRILTPHFTMKDIPCVVINHTYMEQTMFPKQIMSGGTGPMYSANQVFIIGKRQEKEKDDVVGYNFIINVEKSRFVREKSSIPITVTYEGGIQKYSGIVDLALECGMIVKPTNGWYSLVDIETGEIGNKMRLADINTEKYLKPIVESDKFKQFIKSKYETSYNPIFKSQESMSLDDDEFEDDM